MVPAQSALLCEAYYSPGYDRDEKVFEIILKGEAGFIHKVA